MGEEKRGRGRPKKDDLYCKPNVLKVRLSDDDLMKLNSIAEWANLDRSSSIRALINEAKNFYVK